MREEFQDNQDSIEGPCLKRTTAKTRRGKWCAWPAARPVSSLERVWNPELGSQNSTQPERFTAEIPGRGREVMSSGRLALAT